MLRQHGGEGGPDVRSSPLQVVPGYVRLRSHLGDLQRCWFAPGQRGDLSSCRRCRSRLLTLGAAREWGEPRQRDT